MSEQLITTGIGSATHIKNIECVRRSVSQQSPTVTASNNNSSAALLGLKEPMKQRCVIIHRDEKGFGLRVQGDNPVYVDSVREDGAAFKAGVRAGDMIIKVNGTLVTKHNHSEVVKMIQDAGALVALTLLGMKPLPLERRQEERKDETELEEKNVTLRSGGGRMRDSQTFDCLSSHNITAPLPANNVTLREFEKAKKRTIEAMLEKEFQHLRKIQASKKNEDGAEVRQTLERIKTLQEKLSNLKHLLAEDTECNPERRRSSIAGLARGGYGQRRHLSAENLDLFGKEGGKKEKKGGRKNSKGEKKGEEKSHSFNQFDSHRSNLIISMESDDEEAKESTEEDKEATLEWLSREAFVLKFLHFLLMQKLSLSSTLFLILLNLYKRGIHSHKLSASTRRRWCFELYSTFLLPDSPLHFLDNTQEAELNRVDNLLNKRRAKEEEAEDEETTDAFLSIFDHFEAGAKQESEKYLEQFRQQEHIGLLCFPPNLVESLFALLLSLESPELNFAHHIQHLLHHMNNQREQSSPPPPSSAPPVPSSSVVLAQVTCLTTILRHMHPNHAKSKELRHLPSFFQTKDQQVYQSLVGKRYKSLPGGQTKEDKCNELVLLGGSLPSSMSPPGLESPSSCLPGSVYICAGHSFVPITKTMVIYCSGCGHVIWGAFGKECATCFLHVHSWCLKETAEESPCLLQQSANISINNQSNNEPCLLHQSSVSGRKSRTKWRTSGGRIMDNILKKTGFTASNHFAQSQTSLLSSQHSLDQQETGEGTTTPLLLSSETDSENDADFLQFSAKEKGNQITRSESLKQRKKDNKNKECLRKRSDPALVSSYLCAEQSSKESDHEFYEEIEEEKKVKEEEAEEEAELPEPKVPPPPLPAAVIPPPLPPRNKANIPEKSNKRVDIVKELFKTEQRHVRSLRVLHQLFYRPILQDNLLLPEHISLIFANHEELLGIHSEIHDTFKRLKKGLDYETLASVLLEIFEGELGEKLASSASVFCSSQANGGQEALRNRIKKDSKLAVFLQEAESHQLCKRLQLKDILASCFQRITKYPLLLESLLKATPATEVKCREELERALRKSREILSTVNESVKRAENRQRLLELQKQIQVSLKSEASVKQQSEQLQSLVALLVEQAKELSEKELVFEGDLVWRLTKQKQIEVRVLLCTDTLYILTKEERDKWKYSLRSQMHPTTKLPLQPVLNVKDLLTRDIATDQRAFFVVSKMENVLYEFAAASSHERKLWTEKIEKIVVQQTQNCFQNYEKSKLKDLTRKEEEEKEEDKREDEEKQLNTDSSQVNGEKSEDGQDKCTGRVEGTIRFVSSDEEEEELHSAKELSVEQLQVEEAVKVITDEEKVKLIDAQIRDLLKEKKKLILNIFGVSDEKEWKIVQEISRSDSSEFVERLPLIHKSLSLCTLLALKPSSLSLSDLVELKELLDSCSLREERPELGGDPCKPEEECIYF